MKENVTLTIASLLSILLMTFHLTDDIVRGFEPGGIKNLIGVFILVVWLYGTLALAGRRSGYIIILLGSLLGAVVPVVHMTGAGLVGGKIADSRRSFLLGLDAHRARHDLDLFRYPVGAWTMEAALARVWAAQQSGQQHLSKSIENKLAAFLGLRAIPCPCSDSVELFS